MRTPGVVVRYILPQDCQQVAPAEHQHVIEAFLADGAYPPLGEGVGSWRADRRLDDLHVLGAEDLVEGTGELGVPVMDQEPDASKPLPDAKTLQALRRLAKQLDL